MAIEDINDNTRAVGNRLGLEPIRKNNDDDFLISEFNAQRSQTPFNNPLGKISKSPNQMSFTTGAAPYVAPAPFSTSKTYGQVFPASQHSDVPSDSRFNLFRTHIVRQAWKEWKLWNAKGSQLHVPGVDNEKRKEIMLKYWKDIGDITFKEPDNSVKAFDSLIDRDSFKNWGAAFICFLIEESIGAASNMPGGDVVPFTYRNSFNVYLTARNTYFYIKRTALLYYLGMLQNNPSYNPPLHSNSVAQSNTYKQYLKLNSYDKLPLFFNKDYLKLGLVLCEPGDILCLKDNASEKNVMSQILHAAQAAGTVPAMQNLNVHYDCEVIVFSVYNKTTNKIIIRTIGGNIQNSVKSKLYVFDIKVDSGGDYYYDLRSDLIIGIMKFPSSSAAFSYPVMT